MTCFLCKIYIILDPLTVTNTTVQLCCSADMSIFEHTPECRCGPQKSRREQRRPVASLALLSSFISLVSKVQWLFVLDPNVTPLLAVQCKSQVGKNDFGDHTSRTLNSSWSLSKNWISSLLLKLSRQMFCNDPGVCHQARWFPNQSNTLLVLRL